VCLSEGPVLREIVPPRARVRACAHAQARIVRREVWRRVEAPLAGGSGVFYYSRLWVGIRIHRHVRVSGRIAPTPRVVPRSEVAGIAVRSRTQRAGRASGPPCFTSSAAYWGGRRGDWFGGNFDCGDEWQARTRCGHRSVTATARLGVLSEKAPVLGVMMSVKLYALTCGTLTGEFARLMEGGQGEITVPIPVYLITQRTGTIRYGASSRLPARPRRPPWQTHDPSCSASALRRGRR
jgi:hypothetical protein